MFYSLESTVAPTLTFGTATSRPTENVRLALDTLVHSKRWLVALGRKYRGLVREGPRMTFLGPELSAGRSGSRARLERQSQRPRGQLHAIDPLKTDYELSRFICDPGEKHI